MMNHGIHHVPGRLRVKISGLKRNEGQARQLAMQMGGRHGVLDARANARTGSLLIHYDIEQVDSVALLEELQNSGFIGKTVMPPPMPANGGGIQLSQKISDTVVNKLVEKVVERSAIALIAALI